MSILASNNPFPHDPDDKFGDKLDRGGYTGTAQDLKNEIDTLNFPDDILVKGVIVKTGNDISIAASAFTCRIDQEVYTNPDSYSATIAEAAEDHLRMDILVFTKFSTIVKIQGPEDLETIQEPDTPEGTIKIGFFIINGAEISEPTVPDNQKYVEKNESQDVLINYGATTVIDKLDLYDDRSSISLTGSVTDIKSIQLSPVYIRPGKPFFIKNRTGHNVKLWNDAGTGNIPFFFADAQDLVVRPNEVIAFSLNANDSSDNRLELVGAIDLEEVKVIDKSQIVNKILDVTKKYSIRKNLSFLASESIWMDNSPLIEGMGADFITIETTEPNSKIFTATNCQNFNLKNIALSPKGLGSKAFDLKDGTGMHEFRLVGVNFLAAENLGTIDNFRQWFCTDIGFYNNCKNGFELKGTVNGILFTEANLIGFAATGKLFRQGAGLVINDRVIIQINFSVPTGFVFMDFMPAVFTDNEALQIVDCVAKVNGVKNDANTTLLFPNLSPNNPKCLWSNNAGISNTAIEKIVINPAVASTFVINWLNDSYDIVLTANTTFTESNLPATGRRTKTLNITITGNFEPTFPASWLLNKIGTFKKGELNTITIKFISTGKYAMKIDNSLTVYPSPTLNAITPFNLPPNDTQVIILSGSFYTPSSIVNIGGQVVNSVIYNETTKDLELSVTSGSIEGDFDVSISNGTTVVFKNRFTVSLGEVYIPSASDYTNVTNSPTISPGNIRINQAEILYSLDYITVAASQNFLLRFMALATSIKPTGVGDYLGLSGSVVSFKTDNVVKFRVMPRSYELSNSSGVVALQDLPTTKSITGTPPLGTTIEVRRVNGIWSLRLNGVFIENHTFINNNAVLINFLVENQNIEGIKYIKLP